MEAWFKVSLLLCVFGFVKELRPSEPFVTEFLSGDWRNITIDEVIDPDFYLLIPDLIF